MRFPLAALFAILALPAAAATDTWTAEMQMDEGGEVMVAYVDGAGNDGDVPQPVIRMMCFDQLMLRYEVGVMSDDHYRQAGDETDLTFKTDKGEAVVHVVLEDMDGAFAAYFGKDDPVIGLLRGGSTLEVSAPKLTEYPTRTYTLNGAGAALDTLFTGCF
ncbi:MAG: hypothetical protein ABL879_13360 [Devosia sp.]